MRRSWTSLSCSGDGEWLFDAGERDGTLGERPDADDCDWRDDWCEWFECAGLAASSALTTDG